MRTLITFLFVTAISLATYSQKKTPLKNAPSKKAIVIYTETKAQECLDDYYDFYKRDYRYKNAIIRKVSTNTFYISLQEGDKKLVGESSLDEILNPSENDDFFWTSKVYVLKIISSSKYKIYEKGS